jgi:hypothetical protein
MIGEHSPRSVVAGLASACVPGLGQLLQRRFVAAATQFLAATILWTVFRHVGFAVGHSAAHLHWVIHIYSGIDAVLYQREAVSQ